MTTCDVSCVLPIGDGDWTAYLADRLSGAELPLERTTWRGTAGRAYGQPSEASIVLDPDYAARFGRRPVLWSNELRYRRDDGMKWTGPIVSIDDGSTDGGEVIWQARDRMELVMQRRWFWRTGRYAGDTANLMGIALRAADYNDPTGLIFDGRPTGVIADMPVRAGDKTGPAIDALGVPWTVVGDVVRYGNILVDTELELGADAFGEDRPAIIADGYERLSHVCAVTENNGRVFYPSPDPNDRPPGTPLLVDTIDVGDVSTGAALQLARQEWHRRQGELSIVASDRRPLSADFPLQWDDLVPGAVLLGSSRGRQLTADRVPVRLDGVSVELADGRELDATGSLNQATEYDLGDPYLHRLADVEGVVFPDLETYPLAQFDGLDWSAIGLSPIGEFDVGIGSAPYPGIEPFDIGDVDFPVGIAGIDSEFVDPYADCPPAHCCDLCTTTGGGGGGFLVRNTGTQDYTDLLPSPINLTNEEFGVAPTFAAEDLLVLHAVGQLGQDLTFSMDSEWFIHQTDNHELTEYIIASDFDPANFNIYWPEAEDTSLFGQIAVIANAGPISGFAWKVSDQESPGGPYSSGDSNLPTLTTPVDNCILLYGILGMANEVGDNSNELLVPGLNSLGTGQFDSFSFMYWERQAVTGPSTQRVVTYPGPEARIEWVMCVAPKGVPIP